MRYDFLEAVDARLEINKKALCLRGSRQARVFFDERFQRCNVIGVFYLLNSN